MTDNAGNPLANCVPELKRLLGRFERLVDQGNDPTVVAVHLRRPVLPDFYRRSWWHWFHPDPARKYQIQPYHGHVGKAPSRHGDVGGWGIPDDRPMPIERWHLCYGGGDDFAVLETVCADAASLLSRRHAALPTLWSDIPETAQFFCLPGYWRDLVLELTRIQSDGLSQVAFAVPLDENYQHDANWRGQAFPDPWKMTPQPAGWEIKLERFASASASVLNNLIIWAECGLGDWLGSKVRRKQRKLKLQGPHDELSLPERLIGFWHCLTFQMQELADALTADAADDVLQRTIRQQTWSFHPAYDGQTFRVLAQISPSVGWPVWREWFACCNAAALEHSASSFLLPTLQTLADTHARMLDRARSLAENGQDGGELLVGEHNDQLVRFLELIRMLPVPQTKISNPVSTNPPTITLDGIQFPLSQEQAIYLHELIACDDWMTDPEFRRRKPEVGESARPDRWRDKLPEEIQERIEKGGSKGQRWRK